MLLRVPVHEGRCYSTSETVVNALLSNPQACLERWAAGFRVEARAGAGDEARAEALQVQALTRSLLFLSILPRVK